MGWLMLLIAISALLFAVTNRKKTPKLSLLVAAIVPFIAFYYIGKYEYISVFIFASILFSIFHTLTLHSDQKNPR